MTLRPQRRRGGRGDIALDSPARRDPRRATAVPPAIAKATVAAAAAGLAWGWFEAGWLRCRTLPCPVARLPHELEGLRIVHLSDFHLGLPSRGRRAVEQAVAWAASRRPDLVVLTGDLLSRPSGEATLRLLADELPRAFAILGNHDFAISRDPLAKRTHVRELGRVRVLEDDAATVELRGRRVRIAGSDPRARFSRSRPRPATLTGEADLRILLSHYPSVVDQLPPGAFELVLAGHMHDGQICLPYPGGKLRLAHPRARYTHGLYRLPTCTLHVSAGLGTTFVPLRFAARPEATELLLQSA